MPAILSILGFGMAAFYASQTQCDARWGADFVAREAAAGDTIIFSSLSRLPVDHYLKNTPASETTFPAEIDSHPGYEGKTSDPARIARMNAEAGALIARLRAQHGAIFFFHGFRPEVDTILQQRLESAFTRIQNRSVAC